MTLGEMIEIATTIGVDPLDMIRPQNTKEAA
jgi:hypothetical protein